MRVKHNVIPYVAVVLVLGELAVMLISWVVASVASSLPVRSVLSGEGVRWFIGSFTDNLAGPVSVWLLLCSIAWGAFSRSGLRRAVGLAVSRKGLDYRERHALYAVFVALVIMVTSVVLLAFVPHAVLLGVSGGLFPGPFSAGLVPVCAFAVMVLSVIYGVSGGVFSSVSEVFDGLCSGIVAAAPLFLIYILASQLYHTLLFVFF